VISVTVSGMNDHIRFYSFPRDAMLARVLAMPLCPRLGFGVSIVETCYQLSSRKVGAQSVTVVGQLS